MKNFLRDTWLAWTFWLIGCGWLHGIGEGHLIWPLTFLIAGAYEFTRDRTNT